jgi:hypothetical protein
MGTRKHVYKIKLENLKRRDLMYNVDILHQDF